MTVCPNCGHDVSDEPWRLDYSYFNMLYVECSACGVESPVDDLEEADDDDR